MKSFPASFSSQTCDSFLLSIKLDAKSNPTRSSFKLIITWKFIERERLRSYPFTEKLLLVLFSFTRPGERPSLSITPRPCSPFEPYRKIDAKCDKWKTLFIVRPRAHYVMVRLSHPARILSLAASYQVFLYPSYRSIL